MGWVFHTPPPQAKPRYATDKFRAYSSLINLKLSNRMANVHSSSIDLVYLIELVVRAEPALETI